MITSKMVLGQLKRDLIGKDIYRGTTQTYTLLANQFGHFALGFIPAAIIYTTMRHTTNQQQNQHWPWVVVVVFWSLFELFNYQHSVVWHRKKCVSEAKPGYKSFPFRPAWGNIRNDTLTDVGFFCIGAVVAGYLFTGVAILLYVFWGMMVPLLFIFLYWYKTKMYLQEPQFPFHYRLSQWTVSISHTNAAIAQSFLETNQQGKHLLVFGQNIDEKASLCIGIATEFACRHQRCLYHTAIKLVPHFAQGDVDCHPSLEAESLWGWRQASLLIIDDINPGQDWDDEWISAADFAEYINDPQFGECNRQAFCGKSVIWVLGGDNEAQTKQREWEAMLLSIGVEHTDIAAIHL